MALIVKNSDGTQGPLAANAVGVGLGPTEIGREFEVVSFILTRFVADSAGPAAGLASEENGVGSLWTNNSYSPTEPFSRWIRTINMRNGNVGIGGKSEPALNPQERLVVIGNILTAGNVLVQNSNLQTTITLDGELGDIVLANGDCAEEFDVTPGAVEEPGTVMVIDQDQTLRRCERAYDTRVAGVISGAGGYKPAILLDKRRLPNRVAIAVVGKVCCKVDAQYGAIEAGDLLTTSPTPGHAMRVEHSRRALGAVIGKALRPHSHGAALLPILVGLR
jgi:hypothetical protein